MASAATISSPATATHHQPPACIHRLSTINHRTGDHTAAKEAGNHRSARPSYPHLAPSSFSPVKPQTCTVFIIFTTPPPVMAATINTTAPLRSRRPPHLQPPLQQLHRDAPPLEEKRSCHPRANIAHHCTTPQHLHDNHPLRSHNCSSRSITTAKHHHCTSRFPREQPRCRSNSTIHGSHHEFLFPQAFITSAAPRRLHLLRTAPAPAPFLQPPSQIKPDTDPPPPHLNLEPPRARTRNAHRSRAHHHIALHRSLQHHHSSDADLKYHQPPFSRSQIGEEELAGEGGAAPSAALLQHPQASMKP